MVLRYLGRKINTQRGEKAAQTWVRAGLRCQELAAEKQGWFLLA